jgi:hypothetical protein
MRISDSEGKKIGGRGGIRTHGGLPHARFRVECLKPDSATLPKGGGNVRRPKSNIQRRMQSSFWDWQVGAPIRPASNNNYRSLFNPRFKRFLNECCIDDLRGRVCSRPRQTPEALRGLLRKTASTNTCLRFQLRASFFGFVRYDHGIAGCSGSELTFTRTRSTRTRFGDNEQTGSVFAALPVSNAA